MQPKNFFGLCTLIVLSAIAAACSGNTPAPTPQSTQAPVPTTAQAQPPQVSATTPKRGGKITIAVWQSPTTLNDFLNSQTVMSDVLVFITEGLTQVLPDGSRIGQLAVEPATTKNGGLSADGKTVTYKLKPGVFFSDGSSFNCEDVKYTLQARMTKGVGINSTTGFDKIDSVECPDPLTAVLKFKEYYAGYYTLFGTIIPRSAGDPKDMPKWAYNRKPIGTGPFKVDEWIADDHVTLVRNEKYREPGKPYLDQIVIRIVPSVEVATQLLFSGEVDVLWNPKLDQMPTFDKAEGIKYTAPARSGGEKLFLNMAENKDPSDPIKPHPILADQRVRMALAVGINWRRIADVLMYGKAKVSTSDLSEGEWKCEPAIPEYEYSTEKAKQLLTDAGWTPGADGIRVAKGAKYAPDGMRLRLQFMTTTGDDLREKTQLLIIEDMRKAGMEIYVQNAPSSVAIGNWEAGAPRVHGNFDILMHNAYAGTDPQSHMERFWASWSIPTPNNKGGGNYTRFNDPKADEILKKAATELDMSKRKAMFCELAQMTHDQANMLYTYQALRINAYRDRLQGWEGTAWDSIGWNAANWWVK